MNRAWFIIASVGCLALSLLINGTAQAGAPAAKEPVKISIDAAKVGAPMSKYIYGQFIEHLGRCINGGVWAEMLEDRKFYFDVASHSSPWRKLSVIDKVDMSTESPFVGEHTPQINLESASDVAGIYQLGLALIKDKAYEGRIWLSGKDNRGPVKVSLVWGSKPSERQTVTIDKVTDTYVKTPLKFTAGATTDNGHIEVVVTGGGYVRIGTISLMPADNVQGMRADTMKLLAELDSPVYRWPGGNFVSGYNWRDGIGPVDRRPPRKNPAWLGVEPNDFGLDEFMVYCRLLKTDPYIAVNSGKGDSKMATEELEYANGGPQTPMGKLRAQNGHPEPYGVKFWSIGNEMYGDWQLGNVPLDQYVLRHNEFVKAMRAVDPTIQVVAVGNVGKWDESMLANCSDYMNMLSEHFYVLKPVDGLVDYVRAAPDNVRKIADAMRGYKQTIPALKDKKITVALDEWNYWYGPEVFGELGVRYYLKDALGIAAGLNEYARQSDIIYMANYAQTVNVIGAIKTNKTAAAFETTGLVLKLYRHNFGTLPVATQVSGEVLAQAAFTEDRKALTISVVNPTMNPQEIALDLKGTSLTGKGTRWQIVGSDPYAYNDPAKPDAVKIVEKAVEGVTDKLSVEPFSVTLLSLPVK
jgi:alpha-L-arabinofuranosidase